MKYLLDVNVIQENRSDGNRNVLAWFASVDDSDLLISAMTIREIETGIAKARRQDPAAADLRAASLAVLRSAFSGRIVPIDEVIAAEWGVSSDRRIGTATILPMPRRSVFVT